MNTPVAFFIFNRPDTTAQVFAEIAKAKPSKLFVIADGPRPDRPGEAEKCAAARAVIDRADWACEVHKNYSDVNLGCGRRVATGLDWVFEHVEAAIILEDDCLPHQIFFRFCKELLERYRDDERVMMIGGTNSLFGQRQSPYSYHFSRIGTTWGWATWRRAWRHYDIEMKLWPALRDTPLLPDILQFPEAVEYCRNVYDKAHAGVDHVNTWDHQWSFACWAQNGLVILPNTNLVSNLGFRQDATHTKNEKSNLAKIPVAEMKFPLHHPPYVVRDIEADQIRLRQGIAVKPKQPAMYLRLLRKLSAAIPEPVRKPILHLRPRWLQF
jgi:hypothetical protein